MNVDPKQINNLIKIFCELDEEYRGKALMEMNGLFFEYMNEQDCKKNNIPVTQEAKRNFIADTKEFAELLSELSKNTKSIYSNVYGTFESREFYRRKRTRN